MRSLKLASGLLAGTLAIASCDSASAPAGPEQGLPTTSLAQAPNNVLSDQHVFVLNVGRSTSDIAGEIAAAGGTIVYAMDKAGVVLVKGLSNASAEKIAQGKGKVANDVVAQWLPDFDLKVEAMPAGAARGPGAQSIAEPETAFFYLSGLQWNMQITDTDDAWLRQYNGIPSVRVAILDTGLDPYHQDQFGLIDVANSRAFIPSLTGPPEWQDDHFHGTHVGGIVTSNNFGTAGVAPDVTLVAVKVLGADGNGSFGAVIAGIYHAADVGVDVINMSLGAYFEKSGNTSVLVAAHNRAVNYAHSKGVFVVAAAGNDAIDLQHDRNFIAVPCETGVLSCISATGALDEPAYYTNYGTNAINNAAPGGDVLQRQPFPTGAVLSLCTTRSADAALAGCRPTDESTLGFQYVWAQGTSMAAPHIAGLGAYLDSQYGGTLNGSQILTQIQQHADDLGKPGADEYYGKGRMNTCQTLPGCSPVAAAP